MAELHYLLLAAALYLISIYGLASIGDRPDFPKKILEHPLVYTLSLGGSAGVWVIFGAVESARQQGYTFIAYYFGTSILFIFAPLLLQPIMNISRTHRLSSLADLFSYRYNSKWAGAFVAGGLLTASLPLLAWQISTMNQVTLFLVSDTAFTFWQQQSLPLLLCTLSALFAIRFGARSNKLNDRHNGLVIATAFQSCFKLTGLLLIGAIALFTVFGSPAQLETWLNAQPDKLAVFNQSLTSNNSRTLMLIFFAAALVMPHTYHLIVTENRKPKALQFASWAFPLYLLLLSLPVLPLLWAGEASGLPEPAMLYTALIGQLLGSPALTLLAWLCGLAAASSLISVILISVASICTNHLILPFSPPVQKINAFAWLRFIRSSVVILLTITAFAIHLLLSGSATLDYVSYAAFIAAFQFLPGVLSVLYWPRGNRNGLIAGLLTGFTLWIITIILPLLSADAFGLITLLKQLLDVDNSYWVMAAVTSLGFNMLAFGIVSMTSDSSEAELDAARTCAQDKLDIPNRHQLMLHSVPAFIDNLSKAIGPKTANREVQYALNTLSMNQQENRPFALRLLRRQIEVNLSGLFGPTVARQIVNRHLPYAKDIHTDNTHDIQLIEHRLEQYPLNLSGIARELDNLRRYHRNTLEQLPIGVCTISNDDEILMWNQAMENLTGISANHIVGSQLPQLTAPWNEIFRNFLNSDQTSLHNQPLDIDNEPRWFTLRKASLPHTGNVLSNHCTFLLEETSTRVQLEKELLHNARLASIGRLAAGVAHEIGNPVTGIACLAQNLKYDSDQPQVANTAKDIITQTQRITRIVQSLVNFSHTGSHRQEFVPVQVNLFACVDDAIHLLSLNKHSPVHTIDNRIDPTLDIAGDPQLLLQVFLNLLKNALDVIDEHSGRITLSSQRQARTADILIEDNGPGIPEQLQSQIFEPFFTTKDAGQGTGLGLALVYGIIEDHDGHISLQSPNPATGRGSCFTIRFQHLWT